MNVYRTILICVFLIICTKVRSFRWIPYNQISTYYGVDYRFGPLWQTIELGVNFNTRPKYPLAYRATTIQFALNKTDRFLSIGIEAKPKFQSAASKHKLFRYLFPTFGIQINSFWSKTNDKSISITPRVGMMFRSHYMRKIVHLNIKCSYGVALPFNIKTENDFNRHGLQLLLGATFPVYFGENYKWQNKSKDKF